MIASHNLAQSVLTATTRMALHFGTYICNMYQTVGHTHLRLYTCMEPALRNFIFAIIWIRAEKNRTLRKLQQLLDGHGNLLAPIEAKLDNCAVAEVRERIDWRGEVKC